MDLAVNQPVPTWRKLQCPHIGARACHSSVIIDDLLIGFAGWNGNRYFNDMVALNLTSMKWENAQLYGGSPTPRYTHTMNLYKEDKIVVVGGFAGGIGVLNETAVIKMTSRSPLKFKWEVLKTKGGEHLHRSDHTANILGNYLYLFGGADKEEESTNELWMLDIEKLTWTKLNTFGDKPLSRYGHSSAIVNETLYIFGGFTTINHTSINDLWRINLRNLTWERIQTAGESPSGIHAASAKEIDGQIVLFGGQQRMHTLEDLLIFDTRILKWEKVKAQGSPPEARSYYASAIYKNKYIIWGGEVGHAECASSLYELEFPDGDESSGFINIQAFKQKEALNTLQMISQDNLFTDIIFEVEEQEFAAHKAIVAGSCRYFYNVFTGVIGEMREPNMNRIKITETSARTFKAFLDFVYCRNIGFDYSLAIDLLGLGQKYSVEPLKELCEDFLVKGLTKENVLELINVAECFEATNLKNAIAKFNKKELSN